MDKIDDLEHIRKRLSWRAHHRGIKEMDLVFGGFADLHLSHMAEPDLHVFAQMLELPDQDVLSWVTQQATLPKSFDSALMRALLNFRPVNHHD